IYESGASVVRDVRHHGLPHALATLTTGVAFCVLAYSGIESVIQTAGLAESWRDISKAYWFLALTVGIVTPVISALALSAPIDFAQHEQDLITHWATVVGNVPFGVLVGVLGSILLIMAVNTAYVASSELLERVAHRYNLNGLVATNRRASLYRIHILNGLMYSGIIVITKASQTILADMYAIGLLASFCINIGCLLIYRYFQGTKEIRDYHTSRAGRDRWAARRLLPPSRRAGHRDALPEHRLRHLLLAAPADPGEAGAQPLSLPDPGRERVPEHPRDSRAPRRGARGAASPRALRLADVILARPHGGRRLRGEPDAAPEGVPEARLLDGLQRPGRPGGGRSGLGRARR